MGGGRGKGAGTGQPLTFRCASCKTKGRYMGSNWYASGLRKYQFTGFSGQRGNSKYVYSYTCRDCKHSGWSRHTGVQRDYDRRHSGDHGGVK
jgi:hypothetical protein